MEQLLVCLGIVVFIYAVAFVLHLIVPANKVKGYACLQDGTPLRYRLNAFR